MKKLLIAAIALATVAAVTKAKESNKITRGTLSARSIAVINSNQKNLSSVLDKKSKSRVFVGQTPPEFVSIGDLWFNSDGR